MGLVALKTDPGVIEAGAGERAILAEAGAELVEQPCTSEDELLEHGRTAAAILTLDEPLTSRVIGGLGDCRVISRFGIGVDRIDLEAATAAGIYVTNVPDYCVDEVSDHALGLLLAVTRRLIPLDRAVRAGVWDTMGVAGPVPRLRGRRLGVIGFGRLGRRFAEKASVLGLEIWAHDPYLDPDAIAASGARPSSLGDLLAASDVISLHVPLNHETRHLLDRDLLATMPPGAVLINTSRGGLVDETALADALAEGRLAGAGLDVFEHEPPPVDHPLLGLANVVVSSHSSHYSLESAADMREKAFRNVALVLQGGAPLFAVNAPRARGG